MLGRRSCKASWQKEISAITMANFDDFALFANMKYILSKNQQHAAGFTFDDLSSFPFVMFQSLIHF
jgi:hypothetical protein